MKIIPFSPARRGALLALSVLTLGAGATLLPALTPAAQAKPKKQMLELWPGQRVLLVLPLAVGPDWNGGPELAEAIKPLVRPSVQQALTDTGKFSITLPYRFDPILRRATVENRISQDLITPFVDSPSLATAQPVFTQLKFEQVPMVTQVQIEEIRVGGTAKKPTAQLQMSAKLYEIGGSGPFRSVTVTSDAAEGRTPEARLQAAAANASRQIAALFVKAPESFQLPESLQIKEDDDKAKKPAMPSNATNPTPNAMTPNTMTPNTMTPNAMTPNTQPNGTAPRTGGSPIPVLPPPTPPLGVDPGGEKALGR